MGYSPQGHKESDMTDATEPLAHRVIQNNLTSRCLIELRLQRPFPKKRWHLQVLGTRVLRGHRPIHYREGDFLPTEEQPEQRA